MDSPWVHTIVEWVGSLLGSASVPAIAAGVAWKYRTKLWGLVEKQIAARLDAVVGNTKLGQQIAAIHDELGLTTPSVPPPRTPAIPVAPVAPPAAPPVTGS